MKSGSAQLISLRDLKHEARTLARAGQFAAALAAHEQMLAQNPLDSESRRRIGDLLLRLGDRAGGIEALRTVTMHDVRSGHLLPALVGCKVLESLGQNIDPIMAVMARNFAHGAPSLAKFAARQAPVDLDAKVEPHSPKAASDLGALVQRARARALDLAAFVQYPEQFLPVAFFSELPPELFPAAVKMARLIRGGDGDVVFREGDPASGFYFVAAGEVRVVAGGKPVDGRPTRAVELTHLLEGALFGEMALMTDQPRTASIQVVGEADLLEVSRATVAELIRAVPALAERLDRFARERLLKNLIASSPLFKPFDNQQQMELIRRFEGIDIPAGTTVIRENEIGQGLFVILLGEVEVLRQGRPIAHLRVGELFGEMALLGDHPTNAEVRTVLPTSILFLGRDYFRRLVSALPALRKYFEDLSRSRGGANATKV
jgi:CRP-like cAMP-binding protein